MASDASAVGEGGTTRNADVAMIDNGPSYPSGLGQVNRFAGGVERMESLKRRESVITSYRSVTTLPAGLTRPTSCRFAGLAIRSSTERQGSGQGGDDPTGGAEFSVASGLKIAEDSGASLSPKLGP